MVFLTFQVLIVFFFGAKETQASFGMYSAKLTISWHFLNEIEMQVLTHNLVNIVNFHEEKLFAICSVFIRYTLTHQMMPGSLLLQRRTQLKPEMLRKPFLSRKS
jgi:hypothetical protein